MTKISELTAKTSPLSSTDLFLIEDADGNLFKVANSELMAAEQSAREDGDTAIIDGVGLNTSGTYTPPGDANFIKASDFVTAGESVNVSNAVKLLDVAIKSVSDQLYLTEQVSVTSAELLDIKDTPKTVIAAPAASIFPDLLEAFALYKKGTTDYTHTTNPLILRMNKVTLATFSQTLLTDGDAFEKAEINLPARIATAMDVQLYSGTGPTTGDGTLDLTLMYRLTNQTNPAVPVLNQTCCTLSTSGTFTAASLDANGKLSITHGFGTASIAVAVFDNGNSVVIVPTVLGDASGLDTTNKVTIQPGARIAGTWRYVIIADNPSL
jgi:hypothetical protein